MLPTCQEIVRQLEKLQLPSISAAQGRTDYLNRCSILGLWFFFVSSPCWGCLLAFVRRFLSVWPLSTESALSLLGFAQ